MAIRWTTRDIPRLDGRIAVVTGASAGVGFEISKQLALHGAHVVMASRYENRTRETARRIQLEVPRASLEPLRLDLADLSSVRKFAGVCAGRYGRLDMLINNAGISGGPRRITKDGFEMLFQVNYLGHFALTGLLLSALSAKGDGRVVTMSSDIAASGQIDFDDLQAERHYGLVKTYAQSKLADLVFAIELDRRARAAGAGVSSFATCPGIAKTGLSPPSAPSGAAR
jgi:NAD(P)-dependent dehydrogenase (short-subunit alcohol dehydrogenase family)